MVTPDPEHWASSYRPICVLSNSATIMGPMEHPKEPPNILGLFFGSTVWHRTAQACTWLSPLWCCHASWGLLSASATCALQSHNLHSLPALTLVTNKPQSCGFTPPFLWLYNLLFTVRSFSGGDPGVPWHWIEGEIEGCLSRLYSSWVHK